MKSFARKSASARGLERYFTGQPCKNGHLSQRRTSDGHCLQCRVQRSRDYRAKNKEKVLATNRAWIKANPEKKRAQARRNYNKNKVKMSATASVWKEANREKVRAIQRRWQKNNPEALAAKTALRRARKRLTAVHLSKDERDRIAAIHKESRRISELTGIPHNVDHRIPLARGGNHHPDNLQILTAYENRKKGASLSV